MKFPKFGPAATIILVIIVVSILVFLVWVAAAYNGLVSRDVAVEAQWQQVENQIQRKVDLIPQLVAISLNYTQFEQNLLTNLTELQTRWQNASGIPEQMNISNLLSLTLASWVQTFVTFPELHAITIVEDLFVEVTGTENRIAFERLRYNDRVQSYNTSIRSFPDNIVAGWFGFQPAPFFDPIPGGP
jgi:LemA protein